MVTRTTVKLSLLFLFLAASITSTQACLQAARASYFLVAEILSDSLTILVTSLFSSTSKIPSQARTTNSALSVSVTSLISGSEITQPGCPPNRYCFTLKSPIVLETLRPPGSTLKGPCTCSFLDTCNFPSGWSISQVLSVRVRYTCPPQRLIRSRSF